MRRFALLFAMGFGFACSRSEPVELPEEVPEPVLVGDGPERAADEGSEGEAGSEGVAEPQPTPELAPPPETPEPLDTAMLERVEHDRPRPRQQTGGDNHDPLTGLQLDE